LSGSRLDYLMGWIRRAARDSPYSMQQVADAAVILRQSFHESDAQISHSGNLMVAFGGIGLIVITLLTNYGSRFGFADPAGKFTPFFPNDQFAFFILSATIGSFAIELVYLVLAVFAFRLVAKSGNKPWQYVIVAAAVATPILGFYGALNPAPHDRSNFNWEAGYWTIGLIVVALVWFGIVVATRRSNVDNAAAHAAHHDGVVPLG